MAGYFRDVKEETVKYFLYPVFGVSKKEKDVDFWLKDLAEKYTYSLGHYLASYIWQVEQFNLNHFVGSCPSDKNKGFLPHLKGTTYFGDNVEDEWFIVFLLLELSKKYPDLVIKVEDSDGEFLLIETAEFLPKWVNPETSENRVFLYQGQLHLIPIAHTPAEVTPLPSGTPALEDAIMVVREYSSITVANQDIQNALKKRISGYPAKIQELQHRAHCYVPAGVATILKHEPQLVSDAVHAFYYRDLLDLKVCRSMRYFPPETRIMREILFTRCLYAQLLQQNYQPDRLVGWNLPPQNSPQFKAHDLGMKLACGLEILVAGAKNTLDAPGSHLKTVDFSDDPRWSKFIQNLKMNGYFKGELEGSRLYKQLLQQAQAFYGSTLGNSEDEYISTSGKILQLLNKLDIDLDKLKEEERQLNPPDDDSWINISSEQLEALLDEKRVGLAGREEESYQERQEEMIGKAITESLKEFLQHTSGLEGVEAPKPPPRRKKKINNNKVDFDASNFSDTVHSILDFKEPDSSEGSSSGMSDYSGEDSDIDLSEESKTNEASYGRNRENLVKEMKEYMGVMDEELAQTNIGLSFERILPSQPTTSSQQVDQKQEENKNQTLSTEGDHLQVQPIDVDLTVLKNILESYNSQQGMPGPATSILSSMGFQLPENADSM
ncbi:ecdysoneless cell cycle regulator isoform X2 [Tachypleus tridentatus]|uniref:ecdysoneless cell cycle regulator isoform X2 n=1 Tax=Tachypleus tridentatus TaxID=6853 RepID=UPI003FD5DE13